MQQFWLYVSNRGITEERPYEENRKVRLQNQVAASISLLGALFVVVNIVASKVPLAIVEAVIIGIVVLTILLNGWRQYTLSTVLLCASLNIMLILLCFVFSLKRDLEYLLLLFGVLQVFFFDSKTVRNALFSISISVFIGAKIFAYGVQDVVMYLNYGFTFLLAFLVVRYLKQEFEGYRRTIELQNQQLKRINAENEQLISIASHDLRSPLVRVQGVLALLTTTTSVAPEQRELILLAEGEIMNQLKVISDTLDLRALTEGPDRITLESVDALGLIKNMIATFQPMAERKNITIQLQCDHESYCCWGNTSCLTKVAENLISNALKFSFKDTQITIGLQNKMNGTLSISFRDQGPGLDDRDKARLYTRFQRLSAAPTGGENSSGLGLAIAKKYVEAMNGTIQCESEKGKGAMFIVNVPAA